MIPFADTVSLFGLDLVWVSPWIKVVVWAIIKVGVAVTFLGVNALALLWFERKVSGRIQNRIGPYRVGKPHGFLQSFADAIKMFAKEDVIPNAVDKWVFVLAPIVIFVPALMVLLVIPLGPKIIAADLNIGILYIAAITSFTLLGVFMAGWGSNNKYSLLGAMRTVAQLVSYEIPLVLAAIGVVMLSGSLSMQDIVEAQNETWFVFPQIIGFAVFYVASIAELNRTPFDLSEAESELVGGYFTEYSGLRWAFFGMAEYTNLFTASAIAAVLFLGGWKGPVLPPFVWLFIKAYGLVFVAMWIRWTLPRIRIDHLTELAWKFLVPVALLNILITGVFLV